MPSVQQERQRRHRLVMALALANLAVALLLAGLVALLLHTSHRAFDARARESADALVAIARANVASEFARVDAMMQATLEGIAALRRRGPLRDAEVNETLSSHQRFLPAVEGFRMADAEGQVRWGNQLNEGAAVSIADRDYFIRARQQQDRVVLVGPVKSRVSGHWVVGLARPVMVEGRFAGLLYASVTTEHFRQLFAHYQLEPGDAISLRTEDMRLVARHVSGNPTVPAIDTHPISAELQQALRLNTEHGLVVSRLASDGVERTSAYRRVEGWPFVVLAGLDNQRFFAPWRAQVWQVSLLALLAWLPILGATLAIYAAGRREARSVRELAAATRRTLALQRVAGDGIHIVDSQGRLVAMSDSFAEMLGSTRERLLGRHISSWDANQDEAQISAWLAKIKAGDKQRVEVQHRRDDGSLIDVELHLSVADIDGQRFIFSSARDVTERKRMLAAIESSAAQIRDLYDNAPCGYHSLDAAGVIVHVNATMAAWLGRSKEELMGRAHMSEFLDESGRAEFAVRFERAKAQGRLDGVEVRIAPPGAPSRILRITADAIRGPDGEFLMSRSASQDVTAQHEARHEAARLMREQSAMLDSEIVGMIKLQGRIAVWKNRGLDRIFGYAPGELDGQSARLLYPDDASFEALGAAAYPLLAQGLHFRTQLQMRHKDGHLLWIDLSGVSIEGDQSFWTMVDISALKQMQAQIEHIAFHDALTQLPNRLLLSDRMAQAISAAQRAGTHVAVCYLDLDGFKQVNDQHGHDAGDALLAQIAQRLQQALRGHDTAARVGGDEFVLLLTVLSEAEEWRPIVERVVEAIEQPVDLGGVLSVQVGTSVGVALAPQDGVDAQELLTLADQALLRAKRAGKGRIVRASAGR
ncbi:diguanylate cyclase [Pelomonas sp. V22]|uniref:sensor domain-containing diguanylate cyclase n=1 Tax=Pelomonas sp. V22 TaxID=2822139 RepID=UPI0024A92526|nr:diguanylate cyclase [Pelomonas sp. V22]MDI4632014.1 diguanylate cyclase [Pelomonas sp. V22]